ncbi:MAG: UDP-N-acetylglucosamine 2-epimerase [Clostridia bacterium]|nr:UDP-N-acetylglucosamine 2-epimerase [Clostridia bacterium]
MKKVLIFYASYGGGHLSAAKSIKQYIDENYEDVQTTMIDCIKYINKALDSVTTAAYREMAKKAPWAWEKVYYKSKDGLVSKVSTTSNKIMAVKMAKLFREYKPDMVISTHPFSSQITSYLKQKGKTNCTLATVLTDFVPHEQWTVGHKFNDLFFVSNNSLKDALVKSGVESKKIHVTGIPVSKRFLQKYDKSEIFNNFGLIPDKKTVLFFGGGEYGLGKDKTIAILNTLADFEDIQVVAIAGKNEKLKVAFEEIVAERKKEETIKVLPFTDKVPELMNIADLVITKPGGLTVSESLVSSLPLILINPIPGQEEENAEFLENAGAAIWIRKISDPKDVINSVLSNDKKLNYMKENSVKLAKPNSTKNICEICFNRKENINDK